MYGPEKNIHLTLGPEFEILEKLKAHEKPWTTIPIEDLQRNNNECILDHCPSLEIELRHPILKDNVKIMVPPDCSPHLLPEILLKNMDNVLPVIAYAVSEDILTDSVIKMMKS